MGIVVAGVREDGLLRHAAWSVYDLEDSLSKISNLLQPLPLSFFILCFCAIVH
jgi:hypothetical protein